MTIHENEIGLEINSGSVAHNGNAFITHHYKGVVPSYIFRKYCRGILPRSVYLVMEEDRGAGQYCLLLLVYRLWLTFALLHDLYCPTPNLLHD